MEVTREWWNRVPNHIQLIWDTFSLDQQQALFIWADQLPPGKGDPSWVLKACAEIERLKYEADTQQYEEIGQYCNQALDEAISVVMRYAHTTGPWPDDCPICGEIHEGAVPLTCETGDGQ